LEFSARVAATARRGLGMTPSDSLAVGALRLDLNRRIAALDRKSVRLSVREFKLLVALAEHPGKVLDREALIERVWGSRYLASYESLRTGVRRLRTRLRGLRMDSDRIVRSAHSLGYYLDENALMALRDKRAS